MGGYLVLHSLAVAFRREQCGYAHHIPAVDAHKGEVLRLQRDERALLALRHRARDDKRPAVSDSRVLKRRRLKRPALAVERMPRHVELCESADRRGSV